MQIDGVTGEAQQRANETAAKVDKLSERLSNLQKNVLKNEFDAREIQAQSEIVREAANNAHESAIKVKISKCGHFYKIQNLIRLFFICHNMFS